MGSGYRYATIRTQWRHQVTDTAPRAHGQTDEQSNKYLAQLKRTAQ